MVATSESRSAAPVERSILAVLHDPDHADALVRALGSSERLRCCGVASTLANAVDLLRSGAADTALISLDLPGVLGLQAVEVFRALEPHLPLVVLAPDPTLSVLREATRLGVAGFAALDAPVSDIVALCLAASAGTTLVDGMTALAVADWIEQARSVCVADHGPSLTRREAQVLELLGQGLDTGSVAQRLGLSVHTARGHVKRILMKLDAHSQLEAVVNASQLGLVEVPRR